MSQNKRRWLSIVGASALIPFGCERKAADSQSGDTPPAATAPATGVTRDPAETPSADSEAAGVAPSTEAAVRNAAGSDTTVLFEEDFEAVDVGSVPEDYLVLGGDFAVQEREGNRLLELPGQPLSDHGLMFGLAEQNNVAVRARIHGTGKGRRAPSFGVGLGGVRGYQLRLSPAKDAVELFIEDQPKARADYTWTSDTWTHFLLQVRQAGGNTWHIEGKVWPEGQAEPDEWRLSFEEHEEPIPGRPVLWGTPYAGTPIYFDDLFLLRLRDE